MEPQNIAVGSGLVAVCENQAPRAARELINQGCGMLADWLIARGERLPTADAAAVALVAAQLIALAQSGPQPRQGDQRRSGAA